MRDDAQIQQLVLSRGLNASKFRVIYQAGAYKVQVYSNLVRYDNKGDRNPKHTRSFINNQKLKNRLRQSEIESLKTTIVNYRRINKNLNESVDTLAIKQPNRDNFQAYAPFINDFTLNKRKKVYKFSLNQTLTERFLTQSKSDKCNIHEVPCTNYSKIIEKVGYLMQRINKFILQKEELVELATDWVQDTQKRWVFLKIVYGRVVKNGIPKQLIQFSEPSRKGRRGGVRVELANLSRA